MTQNRTTPQPAAVFSKADRKNRTILIPNLTPDFSHVMKLAIEAEGFRVRRLPLAGPEAVEYGKKFVHNDMCYPAQLNIGEILFGLEKNKMERTATAVGLSKSCNACRALQYFSLARQALDQAGHADIPLITNGTDVLGLHPGMTLGLKFKLKSMQGILLTDSLTEMRNRIEPYELEAGSTRRVHRRFLYRGIRGLRKSFREGLGVLEQAVEAFNHIPHDRSNPKPIIAVIGEILVNYHPAGNYFLESYLLKNGMELRMPPLLEFFHQDVINMNIAASLGFSDSPRLDRLLSGVSEFFYRMHINPVNRAMEKFKYYERKPDIFEIEAKARQVFNTAFNSGEGWLIPGKILGWMEQGVRSFIIVQPFGCLPNHVSGRGVMRALREKCPQSQILSLDFDPDVSEGNIQNRLQMMILSAREAHERRLGVETQSLSGPG